MMNIVCVQYLTGGPSPPSRHHRAVRAVTAVQFIMKTLTVDGVDVDDRTAHFVSAK